MKRHRRHRKSLQPKPNYTTNIVISKPTTNSAYREADGIVEVFEMRPKFTERTYYIPIVVDDTTVRYFDERDAVIEQDPELYQAFYAAIEAWALGHKPTLYKSGFNRSAA